MKDQTNPVRRDLVAHIKAQIEAGTYETKGKLEAVTAKLVDALDLEQAKTEGLSVNLQGFADQIKALNAEVRDLKAERRRHRAIVKIAMGALRRIGE